MAKSKNGATDREAIEKAYEQFMREQEIYKASAARPLESLDATCQTFIDAAAAMSGKGIESVSPQEVLENYKSLRDNLNAKILALKPKPDSMLAQYLDGQLKCLRDAALKVISDEVRELEAHDGAFENIARYKRRETYDYWREQEIGGEISKKKRWGLGEKFEVGGIDKADADMKVVPPKGTGGREQ